MAAQVALKQALKDLRTQERAIQKQIAALERALETLSHHERNIPSRRPRRPMSAAERKSVSLRMKRYWASRRSTGRTSD